MSYCTLSSPPSAVSRLRRLAASFAILACLSIVSAQLVVAQQATTPAPKTAVPPSLAAALDKKIMDEAKNGSEVMATLTYISDIIGPRLTGSPALKRANEWAADKMRSYGLSNVHLEAYTIVAGWERGTAYARIIEPDNGRTLTLAAEGWAPSTNGKVQGDVVIFKAQDKADLAKYKGKLKNAIVLQGAPIQVRPITDMSFPLPGGGPGGPGGRRRNADGTPRAGRPADGQGQDFFARMMQTRREMADFLKSEGAVAILQDSAKPHGLLNMTGQIQGTDRGNAGEPIPRVFVAHEHYALLYRLAQRPAPARTRVEIELTNKFIPGPIAVYNTVGEIRGSEKPDEVVIVGAHLDSWDLGQGTTDNGTGSSVIIDTARTLAHCGVQPKRTIRFVLFTGEEQGFHGSIAYVKSHKDELAKISMALAHDTGTGKVTGIGLQGRDILKPIFESELASLKEVGLKEINLRSMGGTDHVPFERAGVPGFAVQQDMGEYRLTHHSQSDTLDKAHPEDLIQGVQVMAVAAMRIANLPTLLPRDKKEAPPRAAQAKPPVSTTTAR
jgi:carboxypeptidase Q